MKRQLALTITLLTVSAWAQGQRPAPTEEQKAALKECGAPGPDKRDQMTEQQKQAVQECMEAKGFKRPEGQGQGQGQRPPRNQ